MSQPPVPPLDFHPRSKKQAGIVVLTHGLPALPAALDYSMSIPVASWASATCAVVLFLEFSREEGEVWPKAMTMTYARDGDRWDGHSWCCGGGWSHDPIASPQDIGDLGGQMIVTSGGSFADNPAPTHPAAVITGRVAPGVKAIGFVQDGHEKRRALRSHFGAWAVCTERWLPYQINALDKGGSVLGTIHGPPRLPPLPAAPKSEPTRPPPG